MRSTRAKERYCLCLPRHGIAELGARTQDHQLGGRETRLTVPRPEAVISGPSWPQQLEMGRVPPPPATLGKEEMKGKPEESTGCGGNLRAQRGHRIWEKRTCTS